MIGRVIRAMSQCWHPKCFKCISCHVELADVGFVKNQGRSVTVDIKLAVDKCCVRVCVCVCVYMWLIYKF